MGLVYANIELINVIDIELARKHFIGEEEVKRIHLNILADSGAFMMAINENIQEVLQLPFIEKRRVVLGNGAIAAFDTVGPIMVKFKNRQPPVMPLFWRVIRNLYWVQYQWKKWTY